MIPPMMGGGAPDFSRRGPPQYGMQPPVMGTGPGREGGFNGYPPFQPSVGSGFDIGRGGGDSRGRGFGDRGGAGLSGRMSSGGPGAHRGGRSHDSEGRGYESGHGISRSGNFSGRGGGRTFDGGRGFGGGRGGGGRRGFDGGRGGRGFDGGRGGGRGGRHGGGSKGDLDNISLPRQDFGNLVPFKKDFYEESLSVRAMSEQDVAVYRARRDITVEGYDVPRPIRTFMEANFPGILLGYRFN